MIEDARSLELLGRDYGCRRDIALGRSKRLLETAKTMTASFNRVGRRSLIASTGFSKPSFATAHLIFRDRLASPGRGAMRTTFESSCPSRNRSSHAPPLNQDGSPFPEVNQGGVGLGRQANALGDSAGRGH